MFMEDDKTPPEKPKPRTKVGGKQKGYKSPATKFVEQQALKEVLTGAKSHSQVARELGVNPATISRRIKRALSNEDIQAMIKKSIDHNARLLLKADKVVENILDSENPEHFGHQTRVSENIYKSFGVWRTEPIVQINNFTPIVLKAGDEVISIDVGTSSETSESLQEHE